MEIRFKFRSSSNFDSIDIGQQSSISVRDLKSRIVSKNHLNLSQDFDLIFSDFVSGQEFMDENTRIPSGSSVIIKRVPAEEKPLLRESDISAGHLGGWDANVFDVEPPFVPVELGPNEMDDGVDFVLYPKGNLSGHAKLNINEKKESTIRKSLEDLPVKELVATHPTQFSPKDFYANERDAWAAQSKPKTMDRINLDRTCAKKYLPMESHGMPSELKCSLCSTFFKEAVMIPCCQHSFCEKCICLALAENAKCPMCSSTKCKPEDLLPNLSLRQAIERFSDSQLIRCSSENNLDRYAPDGESGVQVRDLSHAASVQPRSGPVGQENLSEFQGENEPHNMTETNEEANSRTKKEQRFYGISGFERKTIAPARPNQGLRTCYMCGSPDHLIRNCPAAASSHSGGCNGTVSCQGVLPAYAPSYWPGNPPLISPYVNMCRNPGMMYDSNMAAATPYALPPYTSPYGGYPVARGSLHLGGLAPFSQHMGQADLGGLRGCTMQQKSDIGVFEREQVSERDHYFNQQRDYAERGPYHSGDSFARKAEAKHRGHEPSHDDGRYSNNRRRSRTSEGGQESRNARSDERTSEIAVPGRRISPLEERYGKSHKTPIGYEERTGSGSSQNQDYYYSNKGITKRRRTERDERRSEREYYSHSGSGRERSYSSPREWHKLDVSGHRSRLSKIDKVNGKYIHHERGKRARYSDDDYGEDYHSHKRK